ncbi:hypothetical protein ABMA27_010920 [Loxostege sticticalis]|uniref:Uncharacterized protein n=1 Tax=Loxostege sticticalis TaxID=481309 RepID=A0ABR3H2N1_LOXSC
MNNGEAYKITRQLIIFYVSASVNSSTLAGGMIKMSGTFPVFGNIAVDGSVPSHGTAYVDTANVFANECACFN